MPRTLALPVGPSRAELTPVPDRCVHFTCTFEGVLYAKDSFAPVRFTKSQVVTNFKKRFDFSGGEIPHPSPNVRGLRAKSFGEETRRPLRT